MKKILTTLVRRLLLIRPFVILTETIYVRIYEERMDLLRAAIVGPSATPYHDGLFFFDIFLPPEYPHEPPVSYFIWVSSLCIERCIRDVLLIWRTHFESAGKYFPFKILVLLCSRVYF